MIHQEILGFTPAWADGLARVQRRLQEKLWPMHRRDYMQPVEPSEVVGAHSAGVQIDSGDYQGRHRATEVAAA
ncbi:hypothetical protein [Mycolicibacterium setense]